MVVRLALAPWTARLTLAIVVLFPVGGALGPRYRPSMLRTLRRSLATTATGRARRRLRAGDFFSGSWFNLVCLRSSLPFLVVQKRLAAPLWVFIFGTRSPMGCGPAPGDRRTPPRGPGRAYRRAGPGRPPGARPCRPGSCGARTP